MTVTFSKLFKQQAVKKAVGRSPGVTMNALADEFGVGSSTLQRWIRESRVEILKKTECDTVTIKTERRPQDWSKEERLDMVIACDGQDEAGVSELCREKGLYPHHVDQWKAIGMARSTSLAILLLLARIPFADYSS